jgi:hypothetical protein
MIRTPISLYRQGNATSARMDNIRSNKDIATFDDSGVIWVLSTSPDGSSAGGISTFANPGKGKNWWKLDAGTEIPNDLHLINDRNEHWLWQPSKIMTLDCYQEALRVVGSYFDKIS